MSHHRNPSMTRQAAGLKDIRFRATFDKKAWTTGSRRAGPGPRGYTAHESSKMGNQDSRWSWGEKERWSGIASRAILRIRDTRHDPTPLLSRDKLLSSGNVTMPFGVAGDLTVLLRVPNHRLCCAVDRHVTPETCLFWMRFLARDWKST